MNKKNKNPMDGWEAQLRKGNLELAILAILFRKRRYGLELLKMLEVDSGLIISEGTIYPILTRLEGYGLVTSEWVQAESGHTRKYYLLTKKGKAAALEMAKSWTTFSASLTALLALLN